MIVAYFSKGTLTSETITSKNKELLQHAIWVDLLLPTKEEELLVERFLQLDIPSREERQGIEPSGRLYKENGTFFMTATMIAKSDSPEPTSDAITLIMSRDKLITLRHIEPQAFALFTSQLPKLSTESHCAPYLIVSLLEATIDRLADICERVGLCLDEYSQTIFRTQKSDKVKLDYRELLKELGSNGDLNAKAWESLASLHRLNGFFGQAVSGILDEQMQPQLTMLTKDISALSDQVKFLSSKVNFLLDATLGMVNIEQNNIIKIFSIAAVIFLPPTLIASVYGMNFELIPGLKWQYGYPFSIVLMLVSGWLPYQYFKIKKWL
jgi:magnesium transporter